MSPDDRRGSLLRGSLDLLVLKSLALGPLHGVGISRRIQQITHGTIDVSYGSLFPALHRMEQRAWLASEWNMSEHNRRARYYRLTRAGRKQLGVEELAWARVVKAIGAALESS